MLCCGVESNPARGFTSLTAFSSLSTLQYPEWIELMVRSTFLPTQDMALVPYSGLCLLLLAQQQKNLYIHTYTHT